MKQSWARPSCLVYLRIFLIIMNYMITWHTQGSVAFAVSVNKVLNIKVWSFLALSSLYFILLKSMTLHSPYIINPSSNSGIRFEIYIQQVQYRSIPRSNTYLTRHTMTWCSPGVIYCWPYLSARPASSYPKLTIRSMHRRIQFQQTGLNEAPTSPTCNLGF